MEDTAIHKSVNGVIAKSIVEGGFEGYASTWYNIDHHGDIVVPGAYRDGLAKFLDENFVGGSGHDWNRPIGRFTTAVEDDRGLYVVAKYSDVEAAREVRTLINDRVIQKLSVGMRLQTVEHLKPNAVRSLWKNSAGYTPTEDDLAALDKHEVIRVIRKAQLLEVSPVTVPANDNARIMAYKSATAPNGVTAYLGRIEATVKSIARMDPCDARIPAIEKSVEELLFLIQDLRRVEVDEPEQKAVIVSPATAKAKLALAIARLKLEAQR
jgi:HK97 family phage prohead protease